MSDRLFLIRRRGIDRLYLIRRSMGQSLQSGSRAMINQTRPPGDRDLERNRTRPKLRHEDEHAARLLAAQSFDLQNQGEVVMFLANLLMIKTMRGSKERILHRAIELRKEWKP